MYRCSARPPLPWGLPYHFPRLFYFFLWRRARPNRWPPRLLISHALGAPLGAAPQPRRRHTHRPKSLAIRVGPAGSALPQLARHQRRPPQPSMRRRSPRQWLVRISPPPCRHSRRRPTHDLVFNPRGRHTTPAPSLTCGSRPHLTRRSRSHYHSSAAILRSLQHRVVV